MPTQNDEPISIKTKLPEMLPTVPLERYVTVGGNQVRRRGRCPMISNESDPELLCKVFEEFTDLCSEARFNLNTAALKNEYFRQCLFGQARAHWDSIVAGIAGGIVNDAAFDQAVSELFGKYFEETAYHDQKEYFLGATKAYAMSVRDTATRVEEIIRFMRNMPGAPAAGTPVYDATEKKLVLFRLMRDNWKTNFEAAGHQITDNAYTWEMLVAYMGAQEKGENRRLARSGGRGGRGFGRGSGTSPQGRGGRGHGRNSYGGVRRANYQGGGSSQRFRPNNYGSGQGYMPSPYGSNRHQGFGAYPRYGTGYGYSSHGYSSQGSGYGGNAYYRAPVAARGGRGAPARGGRGYGRGGRMPYGGRGREARALQGDPGYANRGSRNTRSGGTYVAETGGASGGGPAQPDSFDSGETAESQYEDEGGHEMYYAAEPDDGAGYGDDFEPYDYGYEYGEEFEDYGEY